MSVVGCRTYMEVLCFSVGGCAISSLRHFYYLCLLAAIVQASHSAVSAFARAKCAGMT